MTPTKTKTNDRKAAPPCTVCAGWGELEATDIFCGAGGSSLGLEAVCCPSCGRQLIRVTQALNHWDLAVEAHNANFPDADHDVHDVQEISARRFRRTPILWASPDCTHHAYCRGPKSETPEADRSRSTFRDVARFTEHHRYDAVIVENVIEARLWCGVAAHADADGVNRCSCGTAFNEWYASMTALGYEGRIVYFNSQFALPTPQSRDRMYVVFWRAGLPAPELDFRPPSWCSSCSTIVQGVQSWKPTRKGTSRAQPGMHEWGRYGSQYLYRCPECDDPVAPAVVGAKQIIDRSLPAQRIGDRENDLAPKTRERIRAGIERLSTLEPIMVQVGGHLFERRPGVRVWSVNAPLRTVHTTEQMALVVQARRTQSNGSTSSSDAEPTSTVTGTAELAVVEPSENRSALIVRYGGQRGHGRGIEEPIQTVIGSDREVGLVVPPAPAADEMLVQVNRSSKKAVDRKASTTDEPTRTIAGHGELALVSMRNNGGADVLEVPAGTVCGEGYHHGLLVYNGVPGFVRDLRDSAGTITGRDKQSLLVPYYRTGVARPLDEPVGAVTGKDREALVVTETDVDDCLFRMLQWHELLRAQAPFDHIDGRPYLLDASRRDARGKVRGLSNEQRVKMIGNMVSSPVATMLGQAVVEMLAA